MISENSQAHYDSERLLQRVIFSLLNVNRLLLLELLIKRDYNSL